jgi:hypothetical protein
MEKIRFMLNKLNFIFIFLLTAYFSQLCAISPALFGDANAPKETIVFNPPHQMEWKEVKRCINKRNAIAEYIPANESQENWSTLISIQFVEDHSSDPNFDCVEKILREITFRLSKDKTATCNVIEKSKNDIIVESILHKTYKSFSPKHDIFRMIRTKDGWYTVKVTKNGNEMNQNEKHEWLKSFKESTIVKMVEAADMDGLSLANLTENSLDLGVFAGWTKTGMLAHDVGNVGYVAVPPSYEISNAPEMLIVIIVPIDDTVKPGEINELFEIEKQSIWEHENKNAEFFVIKKSNRENMYSYFYKKNRLPMAALVRTFIYKNHYYSISYKKEIPNKSDIDDVLRYKKHLDAIKVTK